MKQTKINTIIKKRRITDVAITFLVIFILLLCNQFNRVDYVFCHTFLEVINIFIGLTCGIMAVYNYESHKDNYYIFIGAGYFSVSLFNILDVLAKGNMEIFNTNRSANLVFISLLVLNASYLLANFYINKKKIFNPYKLSLLYVVITLIAILVMCFFSEILPVLVVKRQQTMLKMFGNSLNLGLFFINMIYCFKNRALLWIQESYLTMYSLLSMVFYYLLSNSNLTYDTRMSFNAHIFKSISFLLFYRVVIKGLIEKPYENLYIKLQSRNQELKDKTEKLQIITEKLTEENIKLNTAKKRIVNDQENYKKFIDLLPDAVFMMVDDKFTYVNRAGINLLEVKRFEELENVNIYKFIHPYNHNTVAEKNKKVLEGKTIELYEEKLIRGNNTTVDVEVLSTPLIYEGRSVILSVARDITQRKIATENELILKQVKETEKLRSEFFANLSHELKTPINIIYSAVQVMEYSLKNNETENLEKYNNLIKQNSFRLIRLINNLIDITKINAGFFNITPRICNIVNVVEDITLSIDFYVKSKNMNLIFDTEVEEKYIKCDPDMIERIMLNLLSNAIKFSNQNGRIEVNIYDKDKGIVIVVKDNGIGIEKDKQTLVFERFIQVDKSFTRNNEGSGIGLSLVKALVELHGGKIQLKSKVGEGSEFIISLPAEECMETIEEDVQFKDEDIVEKVKLEFSDIYL